MKEERVGFRYPPSPGRRNARKAKQARWNPARRSKNFLDKTLARLLDFLPTQKALLTR